jgi:hypothetical protein
VTAQTVATVLATGEEKARELPAEPWAIGVGVFVFLAVLLLITLSFGKDR